MEPNQVYKYCPKCAGNLLKNKLNLLVCKKCEYKFYINPIPCNAVIIENEKGEILLTKRKYNPSKGKWDWPGGFIDINESLLGSVKREIREELGLEIDNIKIVDIYDGRYLFEGINDYILGIAVSARVTGGKITASDDVSEYKYFPPKEIFTMDLAFEEIKNGIKTYLSNK